MTITNGYTALATFKEYAMPERTANADDDTLIEGLIERASRAIDTATGTNFYGATATRSFVVGKDTQGLTLHLDTWLCSITSITNGDGTTISSGEYITYPVNDAPYYAIKLTANSGKVWEYTTDPEEDLIEIAGKWGYSDTTPGDIEEACLIIATDAYFKRTAPEEGGGRVTPDGVRILPSGFPRRAKELINPYKRRI